MSYLACYAARSAAGHAARSALRRPAAPMVVLLGLLLAGTAQAQLGGDAASIAGDAQAFSTMSIRQSVGTLVRYEVKTAATTIHEYLGSTGLVYAISFRGSATPNLDQLLGSYTAAFNASVRHDRRSANVDTPTLRAQLHGSPGAVSGVLWLPELLPPGVTTGALQ